MTSWQSISEDIFKLNIIDLHKKINENPRHYLSLFESQVQLAGLLKNDITLKRQANKLKLPTSELLDKILSYKLSLIGHRASYSSPSIQINELSQWLANQPKTAYQQGVSHLIKAKSYMMGDSNFNSALDEINHIFQLKLSPKKTLHQWLYVEAYFSKAMLGILIDSAASQWPLLENAKAITDKINHPYLRAKLHRIRGHLYVEQQKLKLALNEFTLAKDIFNNINAPIQGASMLNHIAWIHKEFKQYALSEMYANQAQQLFKKNNMPSELADSHHLLASIFYQQERWHESLDLHLEVLKHDISKGRKINIATSNLNIAEAYFKLNQLDKAQHHISIAHKFFKNNQITKFSIFTHILLGKIAHQQGQYTKAILHFEESQALAQSTNNSEALTTLLPLKIASQQANNDYQGALETLQTINEQVTTTPAVASLSMEQNLQQIEHQLKKAQQQSNLIKSNKEKLFQFIILLTFLSLLLAFTIFFMWIKTNDKQSKVTQLRNLAILERYTQLPGLTNLEQHLAQGTTKTLAVIVIQELLNQDIDSGIDKLNDQHKNIFNALSMLPYCHVFISRPGVLNLCFEHDNNLQQVISHLSKLQQNGDLPENLGLGIIQLPFLSPEHSELTPMKLYQIALYACQLSMQAIDSLRYGVQLEAIPSTSAATFSGSIFEKLQIAISRGVIKKQQSPIMPTTINKASRERLELV
ncbi:lipopolysaccharide assembly protein LapB [Paraferrimonas sp. SM1919]|uniref:tetratricopeptide repeat protein n=1 Tax=Paraferrimonas sp. SM1919 TaxID=2662263 RepID=UPI0013D17C3E|nr:hypothetical protein [Paraferrimonas sp. SM1919]